jgi:AraC family transcriptional regulator
MAERERILAKIAVNLSEAVAQRNLSGTPGTATSHVLAQGAGWRVSDIICTSGPQDRPFEEQHDEMSVALVLAGTFQYRSHCGRVLMTPGSFLLGNAGQSFECSHEHGTGDRCLAFHLHCDYFEKILPASQQRGSQRAFRRSQLPIVQAMSALTSRAMAAMTESNQEAWEELAIQLAGDAVTLANETTAAMAEATPGAEARVTRAVRAIDRYPDAKLPISVLATEAGLSPYHFLRIFERVTGVTPHQYIRRIRLRQAGRRLIAEDANVLDIALDSGFGDVSNFNRSFRREFGFTPTEFRRSACRNARNLPSALRHKWL